MRVFQSMTDKLAKKLKTEPPETISAMERAAVFDEEEIVTFRSLLDLALQLNVLRPEEGKEINEFLQLEVAIINARPLPERMTLVFVCRTIFEVMEQQATVHLITALGGPVCSAVQGGADCWN